MTEPRRRAGASAWSRWSPRAPLVVGLVALAAAAGFVLGLGAERLADAAGGGSPYRKLQVFAKVLAHIERNYVEPVDEQKLVYGAIRGMVGTLDPHSLFMPPEVYREMKAGVVGEYGGVGLELGLRNGLITVVTPLDGTPAQRAGFVPGDVLLRIDAASTEGMSLFDAVMAVRGNPGTIVRFDVRRPGSAEPLKIELTREQLVIVPVEGRLLPPGYVYVRIKNFQKNTFAMLAETLDRLESQAGGRDKVLGCVIDLRNNPGGLLDQAVKVVDEFLDEGLIVSTEGRDRRDVEKHFAQRGGRLDWPLVVLVNGGSASASEIVAGALQDHGRAVLLGTRTFGKGSVQTVLDLDDGSGLKLTVARYYTPSHRSIQERGIEPDVYAESFDVLDLRSRGLVQPDGAGTREADIAGHLVGEPPGSSPLALPEDVLRDHQLRSALDHLRALRILQAKRR